MAKLSKQVIAVCQKHGLVPVYQAHSQNDCVDDEIELHKDGRDTGYGVQVGEFNAYFVANHFNEKTKSVWHGNSYRTPLFAVCEAIAAFEKGQNK